jgi:hypothetical protein
LRQTSIHGCSGYFGDGLSWSICPGYPQNTVFSISVNQRARITGISQQHPALFKYYTEWVTLSSCFFCMWITSYLSTICQRDFPPSVCFWRPFENLLDVYAWVCF